MSWHIPASNSGFSPFASGVDEQAQAVPSGTASRKPRGRERADFAVIFGACFVVFLILGALERLNPLSWRGRAVLPGASLLRDAQAAARRCVALAFKG